MTPYASAKVRAALEAMDGSRPAAQRLLERWAQEDPRLLKDLAQPFLAAIVGHALEKAGRGGIVQPKPSAELKSKDIDALVGHLGDQMHKDAGKTAPPAPAGDSGQHADTIRALASAFKKKRSTS